MSAHVLLNLLNKLRKSDKCEACQSFYRFFCNEFNKFNNTGAQMLDSISHMTLRLLLKSHFWRKKAIMYAMFLWRSFHVRLPENL